MFEWAAKRFVEAVDDEIRRQMKTGRLDELTDEMLIFLMDRFLVQVRRDPVFLASLKRMLSE